MIKRLSDDSIVTNRDLLLLLDSIKHESDGYNQDKQAVAVSVGWNGDSADNILSLEKLAHYSLVEENINRRELPEIDFPENEEQQDEKQ